MLATVAWDMHGDAGVTVLREPLYGNSREEALKNCPAHLKQFIYLWKRFIDDILLIWLGSWEESCKFFNYLNSFHMTIKFDEPYYNKDDNSCNFLNLKISIDDGVIHTDLYRKPTDKPHALLPSSAHPNHITTNIEYCVQYGFPLAPHL